MLQNNPDLWKDIGRDHGDFFLREVENHWRIKEAEENPVTPSRQKLSLVVFTVTPIVLWMVWVFVG